MLDRQFLSAAGLSVSEFVQWVGAEKHELNAFENRLFEAAEIAGAVTGGDNAAYTAEDLRLAIDIGLRADSYGLSSERTIERASKALDSIDEGGISELKYWLNTELRGFLESYKARARGDRRYKADSLLDDLNEHLDAIEELES